MRMEGDNVDSTFKLEDYEQYLRDISNYILEKFPKAVHSVVDGKVQIRNLDQMEQFMAENEDIDAIRIAKGRGGNNVAQNMKKSVKSILRKELSAALFQQYERNYIRRYHLKSQKENYVLYFLFLHEMRLEGKLSSRTIENVITLIRQRIEKYARGSEERMETEPERREFHLKNMVEFRKFNQIDLDFSRPREYSQIQQWIKTLYLKKKAVYSQAERKVRTIISEHPLLMKIFGEMSEEAMSNGSSKSPSLESDESYQSDGSSSD